MITQQTVGILRDFYGHLKNLGRTRERLDEVYFDYDDGYIFIMHQDGCRRFTYWVYGDRRLYKDIKETFRNYRECWFEVEPATHLRVHYKNEKKL